MTGLPWTPWHKVVQLRDDLKSGELSLAIFAADLYDVGMGQGRSVYQDPNEFFALTYPTFNLRELAKDVILRLAGKNEKAVRQLVLTYGGGKTHALITLFHLVTDPAHLPDLPAVHEFTQHAGIMPPKARVAVLAFDRLDPKVGMEVRGPDGGRARFLYPWSVLAYQLGGREGLRILGCEEGGEEREEPPFTNVLEELLRLPAKGNLATLILIDEVLMWARTKAESKSVWRHRLQDFFQCLTQAATKVDTCAIVASLLATDPRKSDTLGKQIAGELFAIFRREQEEAVEPVAKEDVAEVLRRRFFTPMSIRDREEFRSHVQVAVQNIAGLDEQTATERMAAEERFLRSYPFHPDLTEIFYAKWTNLEGFQRTRGVLRTFALALRRAEQWDDCPLIGANVFLCKPAEPGISEAARELATVAATEEYEGKKQEWAGILESELGKAVDVQQAYPGLRHREIEQAVFATFLHSQPIGRKALTRELLLLLGQTRPDKIELEKALHRWAEVSWFLDDEAIQDAASGPEGGRQLPKTWRLGSRPNLTQMHYDARMYRVSPDAVEARLMNEVGGLKSLTAGASAAGAKVHNLPERPRDVEDDGAFHYGVLGPNAVSDANKPSAEASRFLDETTAPDRPRVFRNAVVLAVPSVDGLEAARNCITNYLGWEAVRQQLKSQQVDPVREQMLANHLDVARRSIPSAIRQAYCIVVTVSVENRIQAFKVTADTAPLFDLIKADSRARIQNTAISADALLPGGPYDLWREGETSHRLKDLVGAFAQFPHLPKMLSRKAILDTLVNGCSDGLFVIRMTRPDRSDKTYWRQTIDDMALKDPGLEVVLPEEATLSELSPALLVPGVLPGLWMTPEIALKDLYGYFAGGHVVRVKKEGYEEPVTIPKAEADVLEAAVGVAVQGGRLWLTFGPASILSEEIPAGLLAPEARLQAPPKPVPVTEVLPDRLPEAWSGGAITVLALSAALSQRAGKPLPWATLREVIDAALRLRWLERTPDSGPWPCDYAGAQAVRLRIPTERPPVPPPLTMADKPGVLVAEAELKPAQIQDLADALGDLGKAAAGHDLKYRLRIELGGTTPAPQTVVAEVGRLLLDVSTDLKLK
jgi:hypothetical protein